MPGELQDSSTAKALAFHKEVRTRCITLEGDDFNPGGLLTGMSAFTVTTLLWHHFWVLCCANSHYAALHGTANSSSDLLPFALPLLIWSPPQPPSVLKP